MPAGLLEAIEIVHLQRGDHLFHEGDAQDGWFIVLSGLLGVEQGGVGTRGHLTLRDSVGELGALTGAPRSASVRAHRDTQLASLPTELLDRQPTLVRPLSQLGSRGHVDMWDADHAGWLRVDGWLQLQEELNEMMLFAVPAHDGEWARQALAQADRVLWLSSSGHATRHALFDAARDAFGLQQTLVRLGDDTANTAALLDDLGLEEVLHVGGPPDMARLARLVSGRPHVGVLGGGGARAYAHLGVARALLAHGIVIDAWCGTSMGAVIAAGLALGIPLDDVLGGARREALKRPMDRLTLPHTSLFRGGPVDEAYRAIFGDRTIEELRLPFACVSVSLSNSGLVTHTRGPITPVLRATSAAPGLLPPVWIDGELLVDGGVLDNLPVAMARDLWGGRTLAVSVSGDLDLGPPGAVAATGFEVARSWVGMRLPPALPSAGTVLAASMTVASEEAFRRALRLADTVLTPPVQRFGLTESEAFDDLVEVGYADAMARLDAGALSGVSEP